MIAVERSCPLFLFLHFLTKTPVLLFLSLELVLLKPGFLLAGSRDILIPRLNLPSLPEAVIKRHGIVTHVIGMTEESRIFPGIAHFIQFRTRFAGRRTDSEL